MSEEIGQVSVESPNVPDKPIWYFAYGSNMKSSVMKARGITPLSAQAVVVPSHILCFDIFGIPYAEPSFASIAPMPRGTAGSTNDKDGQSLVPVHGVAYLLTPDDYRRLVLTEGAGVGYHEITVMAGPVADLHTDKREILVHTLQAKYPWQPTRAPSARYMGLILEGAKEFDLPPAYRTYLESLPTFERSQTLRGRLGAYWFLAFWRRAIRMLAGLTKDYSSKQTETFPDELHWNRLRDTLQQIDVIHRMLEDYPHIFGLAESAADVWSVFRSGRVASLIGIEGLHQIANSPSILRTFHRLGVRYASLTHTSNNRYSDSATDSALHHGLSADGKRMIEEMNRVGMIVDLSHTSEAAQQDALAISRAPVIFSHSACFALVPHRRNVSDSVLQLLKQNEGVLMVCCLRELVDPAGGVHANRKQVVDHIVYAGEKIGFDHVGIGSDFDGMLEGPDGIDDVSQFPALVEDLLRRGVSESAIQKILGLNILRVLKQVEDVSLRERMTGSTKALCDDMEPAWTPEQREILLAQGKKRGLWQPDEAR
ncbi:uncharacterized protein CDV56_103712 [Aspergillus thermomutatus]|uniref:Dipeptidase n=1 Tax=Aspergillus thermomutatus TaxID=41047 RepID=A0A397GD62_ASPTH|nr:uncharacterized protein CDV56_103712 [Aspergillus thermomutatus]RHZ46030.1 hypothetical protein CDV56_103712 [Aspergillus thermomutatus]